MSDDIDSGSETQIVQPKSFSLIFFGSTPGLGAGETVELKSGLGAFIDINLLAKNVQYDVEVSASVSGFDPANPATKFTGVGVIKQATVWHDGTTLFVDGVGVPLFTNGAAGNGNAHPANWAISAAHAVAPERLAITFATGAGNTNKTNVVAQVTATAGPPVPAV